MNVNFNNLRKQACYAYDKLANRLNTHILKNTDSRDWIEEFGWVEKGTIVINASDLDEIMNDLRSLIGTVAMVYEEGREDFADSYPKDKPMVEFNPEAEETIGHES